MARPRFLHCLFACALAIPAVHAATPPQQFAKLGDLALENHSTIKDCSLGYRTLGTLNADRSNAILFTTWHTGTSAEAAGLVQGGGLFDPSPWFIVVVDALGNGVSCSPSNSQRQRGTAFPQFSLRDMVASQHRLLTEKLGIQHLRAVIGYSMGGMQAFQWSVSYPGFIDAAVPIAGSPRLSASDLLFWRTAEKSILDEPAYAKGRYRKNPVLPMYQLLFAMNFNTPSYRTARTPAKDFEPYFRQSLAFDPDSADANNSLWQIRAMTQHDVARGGSMEVAAAQVRARLHVIHTRQDLLVNAAPALEFAALRKEQATVIDSDCGHGALQCEMPAMKAAVEKALR